MFHAYTRDLYADVSHLYGVPSMYGEYEEIVVENPVAKYSGMYGKYATDSDVEKIKPTPIRAAAPKPKAGDAKHPVLAKKVMKKPVKLSETPVIQPDQKQSEMPAPIVVKPTIKPEPQPAEAAPQAKDIADSLNNKPFDVDQYCTKINPPVLGPLPPGLVLMPGRPDQMSCVKN